MAKTRLNVSKKERVLDYMMLKLKERTDYTELDKARKTYQDLMNKILMKKYPPKEMEVLRKYEKTEIRTCYHGVNLDNQQHVSLEIPYEDRDSFSFVETPKGFDFGRGIAVSAKLIAAFENYCEIYDNIINAHQQKNKDYWSFIESCRYVEDIEEIVPLPAKLREALGAANNALVAINAEKLKDIKSDFEEEAA